MKAIHSRSIRSCAAAVIALGLLAACGDDDAATVAPAPGTAPAAAAPTLSILTPSSGSTVKGNAVLLDLQSAGIAIVKADGDTSGQSGHYHLFIDRDPVAPGAPIPREAGIVHTTDAPLCFLA